MIAEANMVEAKPRKKLSKKKKNRSEAPQNESAMSNNTVRTDAFESTMHAINTKQFVDNENNLGGSAINIVDDIDQNLQDGSLTQKY